MKKLITLIDRMREYAERERDATLTIMGKGDLGGIVILVHFTKSDQDSDFEFELRDSPRYRNRPMVEVIIDRSRTSILVSAIPAAMIAVVMEMP